LLRLGEERDAGYGGEKALQTARDLDAKRLGCEGTGDAKRLGFEETRMQRSFGC
jgi:hypothetical protein